MPITPGMRTLVRCMLVFLSSLARASLEAGTCTERYDDDDDDDRLPPVIFDCPATSSPNNQWKQYHQENAEYRQQSDTILQNLAEFWNSPSYDGRCQSYEHNKERTTDYKAQYFGDVLQSGDSIFESACGVGFNLLMTLEILDEERNITNLNAYGNDYEEHSVQVANQLLDQEQAAETPAWFRKGAICRGDSTNLSSFVPADSFDLVFTGYIEPLWDPLNMVDNPYEDEEWDAVYDRLCEAEEDDDDDNDENESKTSNDDSNKNVTDWQLQQTARQLHEDWHASWVTEMLRIVKPGKFVIVEDVEYDMCDELADWGGVSMSWWEGAIDKYGWDVDPESLVIVDKPRHKNTYNVRMQRRPLPATQK